jgi:hypothetical protein
MNKTSYSTISSQFNRRQFLSAAIGLPLFLMLPKLALANPTIHTLDGDVFINKRKIDVNATIKSGDKISVAHGGQLVFSMGGDAFLLRGGSVLKVRSQANNPLVSSLRLITGGLLAVFEKRSHTTKIVTATATIGIRGTGVYLRAEPHKLYTCTCYGHTDLTVGKTKEDIIATHHNAHVVSAGEHGQMQMQAFEVLDHSDDELRMLEALVGRVPPFDIRT